MTSVQEELVRLIQTRYGVTPQLEDTLDIMKIDSLAMAELTVEIERVFGISIDDDVLEVGDLRGLIAYIEQRRRSPDAGSS